MQDNEHYIIHRKRVYRKFHPGRIVIAITAVCFTVALCLAIFGRNPDKFKVNQKNYYFVQLGQYETLSEAEGAAQAVKSSGGAGYILNDGAMRIMASVYSSEKDAATVIVRLNEKGTEAKSYTISSAGLKVPVCKEKADTKKLSAAIMYVSNVFDRMYKLMCELDGLAASESYTLLCVTQEIEALENTAEQLGGLPNAGIAKNLQKHYAVSADYLRGILQASTGKSVGVRLKYALCGIAESYVSALKNLM